MSTHPLPAALGALAWHLLESTLFGEGYDGFCG